MTKIYIFFNKLNDLSLQIILWGAVKLSQWLDNALSLYRTPSLVPSMDFHGSDEGCPLSLLKVCLPDLEW